MIIGRINFYLFCLSFIFISCFAEDKIISAPLINLEELKPSFEEEVDELNTNNKIDNSQIIFKQKKQIKINSEVSSVRLIGLDKITAKTSEIQINLGDTKKFGPLEIKALKCGNENQNESGDVAYIQVKDTSESQSEKVFIFNGWTFASNPALASFEHAIYDVWLVKCEKV